MKLDDVLTAALVEMGYGTDAATLNVYRDKLTVYVNEAVADLARVIRPKHAEEVAPVAGEIDLSALSKKLLKVCSVTRDGKPVRWRGGSYGRIKVDGDGAVSVTYEYYPDDVVNELPFDDGAQKLIPVYVVARLRMSGDTSAQKSAVVYFEKYTTDKLKLASHFGEPENYEIFNRW